MWRLCWIVACCYSKHVNLISWMNLDRKTKTKSGNKNTFCPNVTQRILTQDCQAIFSHDSWVERFVSSSTETSKKWFELFQFQHSYRTNHKLRLKLSIKYSWFFIFLFILSTRDNLSVPKHFILRRKCSYSTSVHPNDDTTIIIIIIQYEIPHPFTKLQV